MLDILRVNKLYKKENIKRGIIILLYFFFMSDNTVLFATNANPLFPRIAQFFVYILGICFLLSFINGKKINSLELIFMGVVLCNIILTCLIRSDFSTGSYIYLIFLFLAAYIFTEIIKFDEFVYLYDNLIYFFSLISLIGVILYSISPVIITHFPKLSSQSYDYYNIGIWITPTDFDYEFRNYGIFREPGVFQAYLIIGLLFQLFVLKTNLNRFFLYTIVLLTTKSTTGYILYGLLIITYVLSSKTRVIYKILLIIVCTVVVTIICLYEFSRVENSYSVFGKFNLENMSFLTRLITVIADFEIFKNNIAFGAGITQQYNQMPIITKKLFDIESKIDTNTIVQQFASFGIFYGIVWNYSIVKFSMCISKKIIEIFLIYFIFLLLLLNENFEYSILIYIFFFYGIKNRYLKIHN